ncbi:MAG: hypothetical protein IKS20_02305 [Victivallales bacterium]|nr:hypothetical protein [Victivallales bacterium]
MNLTDFEKDVIDRLGRIETKLDNDFRAIHGNGQPGLLTRVTKLEEQQKINEGKKGWVKELLATLLSLLALGTSIYVAFFK